MIDDEPLSGIGTVEFEDLERALRSRGNLAEWKQVFETIVGSVATAVRHQYPRARIDPSPIESAVQSAWRSVLGRIQQGAFNLDGPDAIIRLLIVVAHRKAAQRIRRLAQERPVEELEPTAPERPDEEDWRAIRNEMRRLLSEMLQQVMDSFSSPRKQEIVRLYLERRYNGKRMTQTDIARTVKVSLRTVERVVSEARAFWEPLVEQGQAQLRDYRISLAEGDCSGRIQIAPLPRTNNRPVKLQS